MTPGNTVVRQALKLFFRGLFAALTRTEVHGLEHVPRDGAVIVAGNHLSPLDPVLGGIFMPWPVEPLALADLFDVPGTGTLLRLYGVIPVQRDSHDGTALTMAIDALASGKRVGILPEGRMSVTGALERARTGVAYLALTSGAPVLPCAVTGTEHALSDLARLRRPRLTLTIGEPLRYERHVTGSPGRERLREVADAIMYKIAGMLPAPYRGVYSVFPPSGPPARHSALVAPPGGEAPAPNPASDRA